MKILFFLSVLFFSKVTMSQTLSQQCALKINAQVAASASAGLKKSYERVRKAAIRVQGIDGLRNLIGYGGQLSKLNVVSQYQRSLACGSSFQGVRGDSSLELLSLRLISYREVIQEYIGKKEFDKICAAFRKPGAEDNDINLKFRDIESDLLKRELKILPQPHLKVFDVEVINKIDFDSHIATDMGLLLFKNKKPVAYYDVNFNETIYFHPDSDCGNVTSVDLPGFGFPKMSMDNCSYLKGMDKDFHALRYHRRYSKDLYSDAQVLNSFAKDPTNKDLQQKVNDIRAFAGEDYYPLSRVASFLERHHDKFSKESELGAYYLNAHASACERYAKGNSVLNIINSKSKAKQE